MTTQTSDETSPPLPLPTPEGSWLVLLAPDGTITVAPMPSPGSEPKSSPRVRR